MKKILLVSIIITLSLINTVFAETLHPNEVVKLFINALQQDNLKIISETADLEKIASHPLHSMTIEQLKVFFEDIDINKIKFQNRAPKIINVRIIEPVFYDFDIELQKATFENQEDCYKIISVHP